MYSDGTGDEVMVSVVSRSRKRVDRRLIVVYSRPLPSVYNKVVLYVIILIGLHHLKLT